MFKGASDPRTKEGLLGFQLERTSAGDMYSGSYSGFTSQDDAVLSLLAASTSAKLLALAAKMKFQEMEKEDIRFPHMIPNMIEPRTIPALLTAIENYLPGALGFESATAAFHDPNSIFRVSQPNR